MDMDQGKKVQKKSSKQHKFNDWDLQGTNFKNEWIWHKLPHLVFPWIGIWFLTHVGIVATKALPLVKFVWVHGVTVDSLQTNYTMWNKENKLSLKSNMFEIQP